MEQTNTLLLITTDTEGQAIGTLQSAQPDLGNVILVSSRDALKEALEDQTNGTYFYKVIYSYLLNEELINAKKEFNVKDGTYKKVEGKISNYLDN